MAVHVHLRDAERSRLWRFVGQFDAKGRADLRTMRRLNEALKIDDLIDEETKWAKATGRKLRETQLTLGDGSKHGIEARIKLEDEIARLSTLPLHDPAKAAKTFDIDTADGDTLVTWAEALEEDKPLAAGIERPKRSDWKVMGGLLDALDAMRKMLATEPCPTCSGGGKARKGR